MSIETWKLEKDLCRCCHSEGNFKNLYDAFIVSGIEEMYSYMLKECLDIDILPVKDVACTNTICDTCIARLREASDFRRQVKRCEEKFRILYHQNIIEVSKHEPDSQQIEIKEEVQDDNVKEESIPDDQNNEDYNVTDFNNEEENKPEEDLEDAGKNNKEKKKKQIKSKKTAKKKVTSKTENQTETDPERKTRKSEDTSSYYTSEQQPDGSLNYNCTSCSKSYRSLAGVIQHYRHVHLSLRPKLHQCHLCDMKVAAHAKAFHLEKEHGIPAPSCGACGKKFAYPNQVLRHQKNDHLGEKRFKCPNCDMRFPTKNYLDRHAVKHTEIRDFKCTLCEKSFKWKKNLTTHMQMHLDERNYICKVCQAAFVQHTSLKYHIMKRHPELV